MHSEAVMDNWHQIYSFDPGRVASLVSRGRWSPAEYRMLAGFYARRGDWDACISVLDRASEELPRSSQVAAMYGDALAAKGDWPGAESEWTTRMKPVPASEDSISARLAWLEIRLGMPSDGLVRLAGHEAYRENADIEACRIMASILLQQGTPETLAASKIPTGTTDLLAAYLRLLIGLLQVEIPDLRQIGDALTLVDVWCPEPLSKNLVRIYNDVYESRELPKALLKQLGPIFPAVPLLASRISRDESKKCRMLSSGLGWHPHNGALLDEYARIRPLDSSLLSHINRYRLPAPGSVLVAMNEHLGNPLRSVQINPGTAALDLRLTALGGCSVGASAYVLTRGGKSLLLDCGLDPAQTGHHCYPDFDRWTGSVDAVVISHGHLDHCGAYPKVHNRWPNATSVCTYTTRVFASLLFDDMAKIRELRDGREIYSDTISRSEAEKATAALRCVDYLCWTDLFSGCRVRFHRAGHIPGAAIVELEWNGLRILYSGDMCLHAQGLVDGVNMASLPTNVDLLILESTYACANGQSPWAVQSQELRSAIAQVLTRHGIVLLPSFAIGRSQELIVAVAELVEQHALSEEVSCWISGLAYEASRRLAQEPGTSRLGTALSRFRRLPINSDIPRSSVIIASAGMMVRGSASWHIARRLLAKNNDGVDKAIFFSGYLDEETERDTVESIRDRNHSILTGRFSLSAHAPSADLRRFCRVVKPQFVALVHWGETEPLNQMRFANSLMTLCPSQPLIPVIPKRSNQMNPCSLFDWLVTQGGTFQCKSPRQTGIR